MKKTIIAVTVLCSVLACGKDEFETKPQIKVLSVSNEVVEKPVSGQGSTTVVLEFTDKEGDVDSSLIFVRERLNRKNLVRVQSEKFIVPEFPDKSKGEIQLLLTSSLHLSRSFTGIGIPGTGGQLEPDTLKLSFVLADKKGNRSDTASTTIVVIR